MLTRKVLHKIYTLSQLVKLDSLDFMHVTTKGPAANHENSTKTIKVFRKGMVWCSFVWLH